MKSETIQKGRHRYYPCSKCGDSHPSLTTLLDVISNPALMGWLSKNGTTKLNFCWEYILPRLGPFDSEDEITNLRFEIEKEWLKKQTTAFWDSGKAIGERAADFGSQIHAWCEAWLNGKHVSYDGMAEPVQKAVESFLGWANKHKLKTEKTEQTFYNCRLGYAGTCDWIGYLDGELTLIDWKSSNGIYGNYFIQTKLYALADESQHGDRLYRQMGIGRFGKDGTSEVRILKRNDYPSMDDCRHIIEGCSAIFTFLRNWETIERDRQKCSSLPQK